MFTPLIKRLRWPLGLLLFFAPNFSLAQSDDDSTFNGIDYYAGRIVRGLGGGFEQSISEKDDFGGRNYKTAPFFYGNIGNRIGIQLSNSSQWMKLDDPIPGGFEKLTYQSNGLQAQIRPAAGIWMEGNGAFSKSNAKGSQDSESKQSSQRYGLQGFYLSQAGQIRLTGEQLAWIYYGTPSHWVWRDLFIFENPIRFLAAEQSMLSFTGSLNGQHYDSHYADVSGFSKGNSDYDYRYLNLDWLYGWTKHLAFGFALRPTFEKVEEGSERMTNIFNMLSGYHRLSKSHALGLAPRVDYAGPYFMLHRFNAEYYFSDADESVADLVTGARRNNIASQYKTWNFGYTLQRLWKADPPSVDAFLADWNHAFGNRLPLHAFHLIGRAFASFSKSQSNAPSPTAPLFWRPETEERSYNFSLAGIYGLSDWLELGLKTQHSSTRSERTYFDVTEPSLETGKGSYWNHALTLRFANYRYAEKFRSRFGWEQIREFDRLHGPLLLHSMINGALAIQLMNFASRTQSQNQDGYFYTKSHYRLWFVDGQLRHGISNRVELKLLGRLSAQTDELDDSQHTRKNLYFELAWQAWESIRLQVGRISSAANFEDRFLLVDTAAWRFQIVSLF